MTYKEALENCKRGFNSTVAANMASAGAAAVATAAGKAAVANTSENKTGAVSDSRNASRSWPGNLFTISIPSGTSINFHDMVEMSSPGGMSINVRLPFLRDLAAEGFKKFTPMGFVNAVKAAGGTIEMVN